jgi:hypothetical protein
MAGHTVATDACDGTAAASACTGHTIACKADHEGGSITCNADGTYTMAACTRTRCQQNEFAVGPTLYTAHGVNYVANSCAACPTGTTHAAGDDPDGGAKTCEPDPSSALLAELTLDKDIATIAPGVVAYPPHNSPTILYKSVANLEQSHLPFTTFCYRRPTFYNVLAAPPHRLRRAHGVRRGFQGGRLCQPGRAGLPRPGR